MSDGLHGVDKYTHLGLMPAARGAINLRIRSPSSLNEDFLSICLHVRIYSQGTSSTVSQIIACLTLSQSSSRLTVLERIQDLRNSTVLNTNSIGKHHLLQDNP